MSNKPMRVTDPERDLIITVRALKLDPGNLLIRLMNEKTSAAAIKDPDQGPAADIKFKPIDSSKRVIPRT